MKAKITDILTCTLFLGFLFTMLVLFLVMPDSDFSEKEKRYLAATPELSWGTVASGEYGEEVETYLADQMPGRDFFVGLNAYYDLLSGRQTTKDVLLADGDRIVEAPVKWDAAAAQRNMEKINAFAETIAQPVDLMIVPSAGFAYEDRIRGLKAPYNDTQIIRDIYAMAGEQVSGLDLIPAFSGVKDLYYRTDHHWTSAGAYAAYKAYMEQKGRAYPAADDFTVESHGGFYGSTYSRSGLWLTKPEPVELWKTDTAFSVTNGENPEPHQGLFYEERLEELDKYTVYLDGNHSLVTVQNPDAVGKGKLLVIRDSYANCLGTFLAHSYETVTLVDLRYYKKPVSELVAAENYDDVLVCYSIGNFMTDANIIWLK